MVRLRLFLILLALGAVGAAAMLNPGTLSDLAGWKGKKPGSDLPLQRPAIRIVSAPSELELEQTGLVRIQAEPPARPGDPIELRTPGTYELGYYDVSQGVLDENLRAELAVPGRGAVRSFRYWATIPVSGEYQEGQSASFDVNVVEPAEPAGPACGGQAPRKADGTRWSCTYSDEFDGTRLDRRYWVPQTTERSRFTTGTRTRYACGWDDPQTIAVTGGHLELSLVHLPKPRSCGHGRRSPYAFGQVMHFQTFAQTYGKYEIRALIPDIQVPGVQQSFWLWPKKNTYGGWPASGEIDIAEMYSATPGIDKPFIHYLPGSRESGTDRNVETARCPIRVGEFNTYGLEWEPGRLTVFLNGEVCLVNEYESVTAKVHGKYSPFDKPFFLAMNQAMGTTFNEYDPDLVPDRVTTVIDYVRIWK